MTNEEARKILDSSLVWQKMVDEECEALGMAIKALEQEPCEDCISRQAVLDAMSHTWKHICFVARRKNPTKGEEAVFQDMCGVVMEMPSVTPKQKTGHWITDGRVDDDGNIYFYCSNCMRGDTHAKGQKVPFCWWCGARMEADNG